MTGLHDYDAQESALNAIYKQLQAARITPDVSALLQKDALKPKEREAVKKVV